MDPLTNHKRQDTKVWERSVQGNCTQVLMEQLSVAIDAMHVVNAFSILNIHLSKHKEIWKIKLIVITIILKPSSHM